MLSCINLFTLLLCRFSQLPLCSPFYTVIDTACRMLSYPLASLCTLLHHPYHILVHASLLYVRARVHASRTIWLELAYHSTLCRVCRPTQAMSGDAWFFQPALCGATGRGAERVRASTPPSFCSALSSLTVMVGDHALASSAQLQPAASR